ncbi:MAG TPA: hypothetical protein VMO17_22520 [Terriglobia bacterium]|nr:hypothetical protein [Terriglobia bacterium]
MSGQARSLWKLAGAVMLVVIAVWFIGSRYRHFHQGGENETQVWFYDEQKRQSYAVARDTIPPDGHGVRAVLVAFRGEENDPTKRRVAYLETYRQPLKDAMEQAKSARLRGKSLKQPPISRESDLFRTNDLVKRADETEWYVAGSQEGRKVMTDWRAWRSPDGREPVVCMP